MSSNNRVPDPEVPAKARSRAVQWLFSGRFRALYDASGGSAPVSPVAASASHELAGR